MRNSTLDILRAVAILLVYFRHVEDLPVLSQVGWIGVDLFFVLSGFLVSGLLFREYQSSQGILAGRFLLRRGFKIYPQYYFLLAVSLLTIGAPKQQAVASVFLQNYIPASWAHLWSLAVEEHFYIVLAIAISYLARRGGHNPFKPLEWLIPVTLAGALVARVAAWTSASSMSLPELVHRFYYPTHLRIDSLLAGVLLSYLHHFHSDQLRGVIDRFGAYLSPLSVALLSPMVFLDPAHPFVYTVGFSMLWAGFGILLLMVIYSPSKNRKETLTSRLLAGLGRVSYAFYLWHVPVMAATLQALALLAKRGFPLNSATLALEAAAAFGLSTLIAFLTTAAIERPFLRLRDRWIPQTAYQGNIVRPDAAVVTQASLAAVPKLGVDPK